MGRARGVRVAHMSERSECGVRGAMSTLLMRRNAATSRSSSLLRARSAVASSREYCNWARRSSSAMSPSRRPLAYDCCCVRKPCAVRQRRGQSGRWCQRSSQGQVGRHPHHQSRLGASAHLSHAVRHGDGSLELWHCALEHAQVPRHARVLALHDCKLPCTRGRSGHTGQSILGPCRERRGGRRARRDVI